MENHTPKHDNHRAVVGGQANQSLHVTKLAGLRPPSFARKLNTFGFMKKYQLPDFLDGCCSQEKYEKWLYRRAAAHRKSDPKRFGITPASGESYRLQIHQAVKESKGFDIYTGQRLDWSLISKYDNTKAKSGGWKYKHTFALLPSVDHDRNPDGAYTFRICGWRTNDCKSSLTLSELFTFCELILENGKKTEPGGPANPSHAGTSAAEQPRVPGAPDC